MLPIKLKITAMGKISREYAPLIEMYQERISSLSRAKFMRTRRIPEGAILLDPGGREMSSEEFYDLIKERSSRGEEIVFVVGPPEGFGDVGGFERISLSKMTFQHDLAHLILLEQIYRALLRMKGTRYDK